MDRVPVEACCQPGHSGTGASSLVWGVLGVTGVLLGQVGLARAWCSEVGQQPAAPSKVARLNCRK